MMSGKSVQMMGRMSKGELDYGVELWMSSLQECVGKHTTRTKPE